MDEEDRKPIASAAVEMEDISQENGLPLRDRRSATTSPNDSKPSRTSSLSPGLKAENESTSTPENEPAPKLSRKSSTKIMARSPLLFDHLPDATEDSTNAFQIISDCLYGSKHMGSSEHDALDCDCAEEWRDGQNHACGEDSDCINRATKMECVDGDCNCGVGCQNQRFQRKQYADVSVIKTEKKGFGLRANVDLQPNDFVFEYIGEVINEPTFRRRMIQYDREGIKHFYFMSLTRTEFVDATKKGNLGRFCNHSCNPNCYVDKWVVGEKLRMGIFAGRAVRAGEELVFNYNVDRYGADPQPCYCGEPNCTGFIGGKTQTERATKLPLSTIEALGIDDGDSWDTAVAKKPRKKKPAEDDEEYVNSVQLRGLNEDGVTKVMAALMQCKEKWIAVKLLQRIQNADDDRVRNRVVQMHGYQIIKTTLNTFRDDNNIVMQILDILDKFPRLTKNKISDSKIEAVIESLTSSEHEEVAAESRRLLEEWSKLETAYRIPRRKVDPTVQPFNSFEERRKHDREEELTAKPVIAPGIVIPKGPKSNIPQRNPAYFAQRPRRVFPTGNALPAGWFMAKDPQGNVYYYTKTGTTTWHRPTAPADTAKAPSKKEQDQKALQDIIDSLTKAPTPKPSVSLTPQRQTTPVQDAKKDKWRSLTVEKQMKIYENTLFPHVKYVMDKFRQKLPKDELKRHSKDVSKKLVSSDYKNKRVDDPTAISEKQEKKVKKYVKDYLDRAVEKYQELEKRKVERTSRQGSEVKGPSAALDVDAVASVETPVTTGARAADEDAAMSDVEEATRSSPERKRKRDEEDNTPDASLTPEDTPSLKRLKEEEATEEPTPPPPPPPPGAEMDVEMTPVQADELTREQEEAQRLADEAEQDRVRQEEALQRENEEAERWFELEQKNQQAPSTNGVGGASPSAPRDDGAMKHEGEGRMQEIMGQ
ncbi:histone methyltransferase set2 [Cytospora paraplurivora]|uniref:Histone-lysine N-methyltransferase, H3 lysine-36 specific n=1 Tax=Cytospora paraplurivora TaxID=2898453 RepID=A0AAN9TZ05_9PEZI